MDEHISSNLDFLVHELKQKLQFSKNKNKNYYTQEGASQYTNMGGILTNSWCAFSLSLLADTTSNQKRNRAEEENTIWFGEKKKTQELIAGRHRGSGNASIARTSLDHCHTNDLAQALPMNQIDFGLLTGLLS